MRRLLAVESALFARTGTPLDAASELALPAGF